MSKIFLNKLRYQYKKGELKQENMHDDPVLQFNDWFNQVLKTDLLDPNAMHLSTVCESNKPNNRVVLLKQFDQKGFVFFTNFNSKKGDHIAKNPNVCLTFYWRNLERQVRVEGRASQIEDFLSDEYFHTRSRESQLAAWSSNQSSKIASRVELENKIKDYGIKYPNKVPHKITITAESYLKAMRNPVKKRITERTFALQMDIFPDATGLFFFVG